MDALCSQTFKSVHLIHAQYCLAKSPCLCGLVVVLLKYQMLCISGCGFDDNLHRQSIISVYSNRVCKLHSRVLEHLHHLRPRGDLRSSTLVTQCLRVNVVNAA